MALDGALDRGFARGAMGSEYLDAETEHELAVAWRDYRDETALHRLTRAYLRLAVSMASKFKRYGAPMNDLVQEASFGLMKAAEKFDPDRGVRFSTYAVWWIKASIQDYVMRNWSLVRLGSTSSQKSLFFNLRRVKFQIERDALAQGAVLSPDQLLSLTAEELGLSLQVVQMMEGRLSGGDFSLNAPQSDSEEGREWIDLLPDEQQDGEDSHFAEMDGQRVRGWLLEAMNNLSDREKLIIRERRLRSDARTLNSLGQELKLSKERVRQIEAVALEKMKKSLSKHNPEIATFLGK